MPDSLDFIIGGMPRGGTTVVAILFGRHRDAFCYGAETHLVSFLDEFASSAPVPKASLDFVDTLLIQELKQIIIDMPQISLARGASPRSLIFKEADVQALSRDVGDLLRIGMYGRELILSSLAVLRKHMEARTGAQFLGEKTPSNVFSLEKFGTLGTRAAFAIMREPYSVIKSMRTRGDDSGDWTANIFRSDLISLIGLYEQYASAAIGAAKKKHATLVNYEDLLANPTPRITQMFGSVGLDCSSDLIESGVSLISNIKLKNSCSAFSPPEQVLIHGLTRRVREASGYGAAFYDAFDYNAPQGIDIPIDVNRVMPMSGVNAAMENEAGFWLADSGVFMLHTQPTVRQLTLDFWCGFPESVLPEGKMPSLSMTPYGEEAGKKNTFSAEANGEGRLSLSLDLARIPPMLEFKSSVVRLVRFTASHSFRPCLTRSPQGDSERIGDDRRLLSFFYMGCSAS